MKPLAVIEPERAPAPSHASKTQLMRAYLEGATDPQHLVRHALTQIELLRNYLASISSQRTASAMRALAEKALKETLP